jgi:hypothetical protein
MWLEAASETVHPIQWHLGDRWANPSSRGVFGYRQVSF